MYKNVQKYAYGFGDSGRGIVCDDNNDFSNSLVLNVFNNDVLSLESARFDDETVEDNGNIDSPFQQTVILSFANHAIVSNNTPVTANKHNKYGSIFDVASSGFDSVIIAIAIKKQD